MFEFKPKKAIEAILYFADKEKKVNKSDIDLIKIHKYCYFSDKVHLQKYFRPIFGDTYCAMPEGPVPSMIYDILKWRRGDMNEYIKKVLATAVPDEDIPIEIYDRYYVAPLRGPNIKIFSKTEIEVMDDIFGKYHKYPSMKLSKLSHKETAWKKACENLDNEMDFQEIIGDPEAWKYIKEKDLENQGFRDSFQH